MHLNLKFTATFGLVEVSYVLKTHPWVVVSLRIETGGIPIHLDDTSENNRVCQPGGHCWDYYIDTLSFGSGHKSAAVLLPGFAIIW